MSAICVGLRKQETIYSTFLTGCCLTYFVSFKVLFYILVSWIVCRVISVLFILWSPYV
jgi:hypothetical protein